MKTGELATQLGISDRTLRNWADRPDLEPYLSPGARGQGVSQRQFTESDVLALNTVSRLRSDRAEWRDVAAYLETGKRNPDFPQNATSVTRTIPLQQAEQGARMMAVVQERDDALARIDTLTTQINTLRAENKSLSEQIATNERTHLREIADLSQRIGYLEGYLAALKDQSGTGADTPPR